MPLPQETLEQALERVLEALLEQPPVRAEHAASLREYFRGPLGAAPPQRLARRRHTEWFVLERASLALGAVPVEGVLHGLVPLESEDELALREALQALLSSFASIFEITGVSAGDGVWVRDMAGFGEYPLEEPAGSHALQVGDVLVGRVFSVGEGLYRISSAAGIFRDAGLLEALRRDLGLARESHRGVLRLSQQELEAMFWGPEDEQDEIVVERARRLLAEGGLDAEDIAAVFATLAADPPPAADALPGISDGLGLILSGLAFDTEVDLESARRALLAAWPLLARAPAGIRIEPARTREPEAAADEQVEAEVAGVTDVEAALQAFQRGREQGKELEGLFRDLERQLALDGEDIDEDDPAPDFPGVVGAMVEEYLWELGLQRGADAAEKEALLRKLADFAGDIGVFENLGQRELLAFATLWLPERGKLASAEEASAMLDALHGFCSWSTESQDHDLLSAFHKSLAPLRESLPRLTRANLLCEASQPRTGEMLEVVGVGDDGARVRDGAGRAFAVTVDARILAELREGDRLRGERDGGVLRVFCCYPSPPGLPGGP